MTLVEAAARTVPTRDRTRVDAAVRTGAASILASAVGLVTAWWIVDGGLTTSLAGGAALTSAGRLTGLLASVLLLAQVVLMARVPVLERAVGQDVLARLHRLVGFTSFNLMLAHAGLTTLGYAGGSLGASPGTFWDLSVDYPGMLLALAGSLCLVMVVVTSVKAARGRLRYESWHLLHLYAYLGVGLALPHQLWTGEQFTTHPARTAFWWGAWALAAGSILVWRLGVPASAPGATTCGSPRWPASPPDVVSVYVTVAEPAPPPRAGGPVPDLALPRRPWLVPGAPVLPVRGAGRPEPADHRQGPRATAAAPWLGWRRAPARSSRARTDG